MLHIQKVLTVTPVDNTQFYMLCYSHNTVHKLKPLKGGKGGPRGPFPDALLSLLHVNNFIRFDRLNI